MVKREKRIGGGGGRGEGGEFRTLLFLPSPGLSLRVGNCHTSG